MFLSDTNFDTEISRLDLDLYSKIDSETTSADKKSLLAIQNAVRNSKESFVYLEIGSFLGGSIQPYLLDSKCKKIFSIDKRPEIQADERYLEGWKYSQNTTQGMLDNLKKISEENISKIVTFDNDASNVEKTKINPKADICFIDGEHTNSHVISDFIFCKHVINGAGLIVFHDCDVLFQGILFILRKLKRDREKFKAYFLSECVFVISFDNIIVDNEKGVRLLRRKMFKRSIKNWILWSIFPSYKAQSRLRKYKSWLLKTLFTKLLF